MENKIKTRINHFTNKVSNDENCTIYNYIDQLRKRSKIKDYDLKRVKEIEEDDEIFNFLNYPSDLNEELVEISDAFLNPLNTHQERIDILCNFLAPFPQTKMQNIKNSFLWIHRLIGNYQSCKNNLKVSFAKFVKILIKYLNFEFETEIRRLLIFLFQAIFRFHNQSFNSELVELSLHTFINLLVKTQEPNIFEQVL